MTIKALAFIHELLIREEETTNMVLDFARKQHFEAVEGMETGTHTKEEFEQTKRICEEMRVKHNRAYNALQEFEAEEF